MTQRSYAELETLPLLHGRVREAGSRVTMVGPVGAFPPPGPEWVPQGNVNLLLIFPFKP